MKREERNRIDLILFFLEESLTGSLFISHEHWCDLYECSVLGSLELFTDYVALHADVCRETAEQQQFLFHSF